MILLHVTVGITFIDKNTYLPVSFKMYAHTNTHTNSHKHTHTRAHTHTYKPIVAYFTNVYIGFHKRF